MELGEKEIKGEVCNVPDNTCWWKSCMGSSMWVHIEKFKQCKQYDSWDLVRLNEVYKAQIS